MLKTNKPLKAKTQLKAKRNLVAKTTVKKVAKHPKSRLIKKADTLFSWAVRLRDSELVDGAWQGICITCAKVILVKDANGKWKHTSNIGHFISRGDFNLRYDEENCNLQCAHCNAWRDKESMLEAYRTALDAKYGDGTAAKLKLAHQDHTRNSLTRPELEQIIEDSKKEIAFYESSNL